MILSGPILKNNSFEKPKDDALRLFNNGDRPWASSSLKNTNCAALKLSCLAGNLFILMNLARMEYILKHLTETQFGQIHAPSDFGINPIRAIHDEDLIKFLQNA